MHSSLLTSKTEICLQAANLIEVINNEVNFQTLRKLQDRITG